MASDLIAGGEPQRAKTATGCDARAIGRAEALRAGMP
jgi:hypothetical protein